MVLPGRDMYLPAARPSGELLLVVACGGGCGRRRCPRASRWRTPPPEDVGRRVGAMKPRGGLNGLCWHAGAPGRWSAPRLARSSSQAVPALQTARPEHRSPGLCGHPVPEAVPLRGDGCAAGKCVSLIASSVRPVARKTRRRSSGFPPRWLRLIVGAVSLLRVSQDDPWAFRPSVGQRRSLVRAGRSGLGRQV